MVIFAVLGAISTVLGLAPTAVVLFSTALADLAQWVHPSIEIHLIDVRP